MHEGRCVVLGATPVLGACSVCRWVGGHPLARWHQLGGVCVTTCIPLERDSITSLHSMM
jgi:hypothetical protein